MLVDIAENRFLNSKLRLGAKDNMELHEVTLKSMRQGEVAWFELTPEAHNNRFHELAHIKQLSEAEQMALGSKIYLKLTYLKTVKHLRDTFPRDFNGRNAYVLALKELAQEVFKE